MANIALLRTSVRSRGSKLTTKTTEGTSGAFPLLGCLTLNQTSKQSILFTKSMLFQILNKQKDWTLALLVVDGHRCCELALGVGHGQWTCEEESFQNYPK